MACSGLELAAGNEKRPKACASSEIALYGYVFDRKALES